MSKINILLTEANGIFAKSKEMIVGAIREAEGFVFPLFRIDWGIDIVVSNRLYNLKVFFTGDDELPRWSGYSLGFYLVKKYLEKTGKKIEDVFADKYDEFRVVL